MKIFFSIAFAVVACMKPSKGYIFAVGGSLSKKSLSTTKNNYNYNLDKIRLLWTYLNVLPNPINSHRSSI